jgi:hypothetical protein
MTANFGNALLLHTAAVFAISNHLWLAGFCLALALTFSLLYARYAGASWMLPERWQPATVGIFCLIWVALCLVAILRSMGGSGQDRRAQGQANATQEPTSRGVILRPKFDKVKLVPPRPKLINLEERRQAAVKKQLIPFRGFYWIFQPPDRMPPPSSPIQVGAPSQFRFRSNDTSPLRLSADERFETPHSLQGASAMEFEIETTEEGLPSFAGRLILRDTSQIPHGIIRVSERPFVSEDGHYKVRFDLPASKRISKFDRLTLDFVSDFHRMHIAPRVALLGFRFL